MADNTLLKCFKPNEEETPLNSHKLMDMLMGFQKSQIIYTATQLGIFEEIHRKEEGATSQVVAKNLSLDPSSVERLLNTCVSLGLLISQAETGLPTCYRCSSLTKNFLLKSSKMSMKPLVQNVGGMYQLYANLPQIIKEGQCQNGVEDMFDESGGSYYSHDAQKLAFMKTMHMFMLRESKFILAAFDLTDYKNICDLGGSTGALAAEVAKTYPSSNVTSFDLPHVTNAAIHFYDKLPNNMQFISGDFFNDILPCADLYILSNALHDWCTNKINFLLQSILNRLPSGGCLMILEKVLNDSKIGPLPTALMDMNMLVGSEGKERSGPEYKQLLLDSGFTDVNIIPLQHTVHRDIILAYK